MPEELTVGGIITDVGSHKLIEAVHEDKKVDIKYVAIGDGNGDPYQPTKDMTELKNLCWQGEIRSYAISPDDDKQLMVNIVIPSDVGHFTMREIGLLDADGDLIAISNTTDIELVSYTSGQVLTLNTTFILQFKTEEFGGVNVVVKPSEEEVLKQEIVEACSFYVCDIADIKEVVGQIWQEPYKPEKPEFATDEDIDDFFE